MILHAKLEIVPTDSCVEWTGAYHKNGYGVLSLNRKVASELGLGRVQFVHGASYIQHHGPIPEGLVVRHKCDNKACFNPAHLEIGTHRDNVDDAVERGLVKRKLTMEEAECIRESSESNRKLAKRFGVSATTVYHIKKGNKWRKDNG